MSQRDTRDARALERELAGALTVLASARRALATDQLPQLARLIAVLEPLHARLGALSPAARQRPPRELLALLDEAAALTDGLSAAHAQLKTRLREAGTQRRAGAAYHRAGKL